MVIKVEYHGSQVCSLCEMRGYQSTLLEPYSEYLRARLRFGVSKIVDLSNLHSLRIDGVMQTA